MWFPVMACTRLQQKGISGELETLSIRILPKCFLIQSNDVSGVVVHLSDT